MKKIPVRQITESSTLTGSAERFKIRTVPEILKGNALQQDLHRHDFFFILLLETGRGSHEIDFTHYEVVDNSIFILRPGQVHQLQLNAVCTGYLMEFNAAFYHPTDKLSSERLRKASNKNYCKLEEERFERVNGILSQIFQEYTNREESYEEVIKANLGMFFIELARQSSGRNSMWEATKIYTHERLEEFLGLLEKHIGTHKQVTAYTGLMNVSTYQLNEITKASIGKTPSQLINEQIILEAKRYLLATPNQVKDIADDLGYEDVSYFIRFFKRHTGRSPEAFRQNRG
jgi:AraC family transcriptional regulator, transcriptional activator of pobA